VSTHIRPIRGEELEAFVRVLETAAGRQPSAATMPGRRTTYRPERTLAAYDGDRMVGGTASEPIELTLPGGAPGTAAKVTLTGLLPGFRGRGIASAFMQRQLRDLRDWGEPFAALTTTQSGVPGRHGFSPATQALALVATPSRRARTTIEIGGVETRLVDRHEAEPVLPGVYDRHRRQQAGQVSRSIGFWQEWFLDHDLVRMTPAERFFVLASSGDNPGDRCDGYLTYRLIYGPLREQPVSELVIEDLVAVTDSARRALWRFCLEFDQAPHLSAWNLPADEPLPWAAEASGVRVTALRPFLRLRIIDVPWALAARRYGVTDQLVIEVVDPVLPVNGGCYRLDGGPHGAACARTTRPPDLTMSVAELAAVYLGGFELTTLARAGRVTEHRAGSLRRADAMFAWWPRPWTITDW
jgi:predicted acetyltransferase